MQIFKRQILRGSILFFMVLLWSPGIPWAQDRTDILGPLPLRNYQPIHLLFYEFVPERAYALRQGSYLVRLDMTETSTILDDLNKEPSFIADLEMSRFTWRGFYGLSHNVTVGIEVPLVHTFGGILDPFIEGTERLLNELREDRRLEEDGDFRFFLDSLGDRVLEGDRGAFGIGDVALEGMWQFLEERGPFIPAMALRGAIKFPTGDLDRVFGSEKFDGAVGFAAQKIWGRWSASANFGLTIISDPFDRPELETKPVIASGSFSLERLITSTISLILQANNASAPFEKTGTPTVRPLSDSTHEVVFGIKWGFGKASLLQFAFVEDFADRAAVDADVTFLTSIGYRFGR